MDKIAFFSKWTLRIGIGIAAIYDLFIQNWVGIAGGFVVFLLTFLIDLINYRKKNISNGIIITFSIYCIFSLICGVMLDFYDFISWWDILMHLFAGAFLGIIGDIILNKYCADKIPQLIRFIYIIGFAIMCGVLWEIYEFTADIILKTDMQCVISSGISDTMVDLISDLLGGFAAAIGACLVSSKIAQIK